VASDEHGRRQTDAFDAEYFQTLYGGEAKQTWFDRARDDRVERLVRRFAPRPDADAALLDIGCGYGYLLARFAGRYRLFGVDVAVHAAHEALARLPNLRVVAADAQRQLPLTRRFDVVLAINVIEHLSDPAAGARTIGEALLPGGVCVVHLPTINNAVSRAVYRFAYAGDPTHIYRPSGAEVRRLFESEGFRTLDEAYAPFAPRALWKALKVHPAYLAAFRRADSD
jgi:SAM-dependent methyltransferase